eukprot:373718-Hanusia_phi.AAC.1
MPVRLVACSSEDDAHRGGNALQEEAYVKWLLRKGEDQGYLVLKVEPPSPVYAIEILNAGSQFVEVLASEEEHGEEWRSLMRKALMRTELEFKQGKGAERSRTFAYGDSKASLLPCSSTTRWCRLKVMVSCLSELLEPDKMIGLACVKIQTENPLESAACCSPNKTSKEVVQVSPSSVDQHSSTFTARASNASKCNPLDEEKQKPALHFHCAGSPSSTLIPPDDKEQLKRKNAQEQAHKKRTNTRDVIQLHQMSGISSKKVGEVKRGSDASNTVKSDASSRSQQLDQAVPAPAKRRKEAKPAERFPLRGVYIAISGIENPHRAQLREQALALGAQYAPQWTTGCTHLICAFPNTPKYRQAKSDGGVVVKASWLEHCATDKRRLPTSQYEM